jgi:hypothetical protein
MSELFKLQKSRVAVSLALLEKGVKWEALRPLVQQWWSDLKAWEAPESFEAAFNEDRMTVRQINIGFTARRHISAGRKDRERGRYGLPLSQLSPIPDVCAMDQG